MISVIIPVYNAEKDIHICLNSILVQSYENFEVICIDDNSSDSSLEILEYFSKKDSRVKIIKNDFNRGFGFCRNKGMNEAKGDYLIFLNTEDWLRSNAFELLINNMKIYKSDILFFKSITSDEKGNFIIDESKDSFFSNFENNSFNHFDFKKTEIFEMEKSLSNQFYSKSFLENFNINFPNENRINDYIPFLFKAITSANKISIVNKRISYTQNILNLSNLSNERLFDCFDIIYFILEVFLDNIQLYAYYKKELFNYIFNGFYHVYCNIDNKFKERFFREVQVVYKNFITNYGLYQDICKYSDENVLMFFKFDEIMFKINNPPKISIIVPIYNTENELPNVLDAIINQTIGFENIELILVDDCSTDSCGEIINNYSKKYPNIFPIHLFENSGSPSKPRNIGIRNASSEYIIFNDSDDCFSVDACEILYETMVDESVDFVAGMITRNDADINNYEIHYEPWNFVLNYYDEFKNKDIEKILGSEKLFKYRINSVEENKFILIDYSLNSKLYKKSLFIENNIKFLEYLDGAEDAIVLFEYLIKSKTCVFINKVIFGYNVHRLDSLTHNFSFKTIKSRPKAYQIMYDIAVLNNKKDFFIDLILWRKLKYWITFHLIKAPNLEYDDVLSLFKSYQNLFCECLSFSEIPKCLKNICEDIKNNSFDNAAQRVMNKRLK